MKRISIFSQYFSHYFSLIFVIITAFILNSCGATGPLQRNYEFAIASPSQAARAEVRACFQYVNQLTGIEMLHIASEHTSAGGLSDKQSQVHIIPGVKYRDPDTQKMRIAQAQYLIHGGEESTTMKVMFDWDTYLQNGARTGEATSSYNLRTCAHEVGHGMGRKHVQNDPTRIMYPLITSQFTNLTWPIYRDNLTEAFKADSPADI